MIKQIITWACGEEFFQSIGFNIFLNSIKEQKACDNLTICSDKFPKKWTYPCNVSMKLYESSDVFFLFRDRWYHYYQILKNTRAEAVLLCDSKDVLFQDDPFKIINDLDLKDEFLLLCKEGIKHKESDWNGADQFRCQFSVTGEWKKEFEHFDVLNAGYVLGTPKKLSQLALLIWTNMIRSGKLSFSDQGMLNFLYMWIHDDPEIFICDPIDHNFCLTGQGVVQNKITPNFENGIFYNQKTKQKYYSVHQWDRTEHRNIIEERSFK